MAWLGKEMSPQGRRHRDKPSAAVEDRDVHQLHRLAGSIGHALLDVVVAADDERDTSSPPFKSGRGAADGRDVLLTAEAPPRQYRAPRRAAPGPGRTLSLELRERTRDAHVAAEAAFALDARLTSREAYTELLVALRGFYRPVEAALVTVTGWERLAPPLDVVARCRAAWLDEDLARLGWDGPTPVRVLPPPPLGSLAEALGCLYVLEGSALGGRIIARQARRALGGDVPVAFFSSAGRVDLGADWRTLQAALDAFGADDAPARDVAVAAAHDTFGALGAWIEQEAPKP